MNAERTRTVTAPTDEAPSPSPSRRMGRRPALGALAAWVAGLGNVSCTEEGRTDGVAESGPGGGSGAGGVGGATGVSGVGGVGGAGGAGGPAPTTGGGGAPTPSCDEPTEVDIEGPYYLAGAPLLEPDAAGRAVLSPDEPGERFVLVGSVQRVGCVPIASAELDLWQADADGIYDVTGYTLRGRVQTGADGRFEISTVLPGRYLNGGTYRPRHLHVKVRAAGHDELTTQLYFPGDPYNESDAFFDALLLVSESEAKGERFARFDFVLVAT